MKRVESLKKVNILIEIADNREFREPIFKKDVEFVFGIGSKGLSPFEYMISGRAEGEEIIESIESWKLHSLFDPPYIFFDTPKTKDMFFLRAKVKGISTPSQREVISALAEASRCKGCCDSH